MKNTFVILFFASALPLVSCHKVKKDKALDYETKITFQRDYDDWQEKCPHDSDICKTYINFTPNSFPETKDGVVIRFYNNDLRGIYKQQDSLRELKKETKKCKIVRMHTTVYGFDK